MNAYQIAARRTAAQNLRRFTAWVAIMLLATLLVGFTARAMNVELPEVYKPEPVHETPALTAAQAPRENP